MKLLLINASPRRERSNTLKISRAFADGFPDFWEREEITLSDLEIKPCLGCFSCWGKTKGQCVIKDDMDGLRLKLQLADVIIESFPLYFFGMPSGLKAMTDRCLPFMLPYGGELGGDMLFHQLRDGEMLKKKLVVISSCGYGEAEPMYKALVSQLDLICGKDRYTHIFCPQGELFFSGTASRQQRAYLETVTAAGKEFAEKFKIDSSTVDKLKKPLLSPKGFETVTKGHKEWFPDPEQSGNENIEVKKD
ncbi:MAG: flavodoxin family protein [Firmicutes bacterium]|nr:flavodoxin family protein [Bacillota bacterium]